MRLARGQRKLPGLLIARLKSLYLIGPEIQKEIIPRGCLSKKAKLVLLTVKNNRRRSKWAIRRSPRAPFLTQMRLYGENLGHTPLADIRVGKQNSEVKGHQLFLFPRGIFSDGPIPGKRTSGVFFAFFFGGGGSIPCENKLLKQISKRCREPMDHLCCTNQINASSSSSLKQAGDDAPTGGERAAAIRDLGGAVCSRPHSQACL